MLEEYSFEEMLELYRHLPENIKALIEGDNLISTVERIAEKNKIDKKNLSLLVDLSSAVLFGLLPPQEFAKELKEKLGLPEKIIRRLDLEIHRFIFFPVRRELERIYQTQVQAKALSPFVVAEENKKEQKKVIDRYREPIE